jgi:hypothetical protein
LAFPRWIKMKNHDLDRSQRLPRHEPMMTPPGQIINPKTATVLPSDMKLATQGADLGKPGAAGTERCAGADWENEKTDWDHGVGRVEQNQQADGDHRHAQIVRQCGLRHQPPVPGHDRQLGKINAEPDREHHFDERDRDEHVDELRSRHGWTHFPSTKKS